MSDPETPVIGAPTPPPAAVVVGVSGRFEPAVRSARRGQLLGSAALLVAIVGASGHYESGYNAGAAYVFRILGSPDCDLDGINDACEPDCNENGSPDGCDIVDETSDDCNTNGIPDDCEPDCNGNSIADSCDIRDGTSDDCDADGIPDLCGPAQDDCNTNDIADGCDIASGTSPDCTGNGIPDECEPPLPDCNGNAVADGCDVAGGTSLDCNSNATPDECDIAEGTGLDCNRNNVPDSCDIADDTSEDCNDNQAPDECEPCAGIRDIPCGPGEFCRFCVGECGAVNSIGACKAFPGPFCPPIYDPVCGCDGVTYDNECEADRTGVSLDHYGVCGDPPVVCCLPTGVCTASWASTCRTLEGTQVPACLGDANADHIDEACDCDASMTPDGCDVAAGLLKDLDQDGIPDECGACCGPGQCVQVIETECAGKYRGDGTKCEQEVCGGIPTVSEWGLIVLAVLLVAAGTVVLPKRRSPSTA